jgi:hypothetical protein
MRLLGFSILTVSRKSPSIRIADKNTKTFIRATDIALDNLY